MSLRNVLRIEKKKKVSADTNITDAYKVPYGQSNVGSALDEVTTAESKTFTSQISGLYCYKCGRIVTLFMENAQRTWAGGYLATGLPKPIKQFVSASYAGISYTVGSSVNDGGRLYADAFTNKWDSFCITYLTDD